MYAGQQTREQRQPEVCQRRILDSLPGEMHRLSDRARRSVYLKDWPMAGSLACPEWRRLEVDSETGKCLLCEEGEPNYKLRLLPLQSVREFCFSSSRRNLRKR